MHTFIGRLDNRECILQMRNWLSNLRKVTKSLKWPVRTHVGPGPTDPGPVPGGGRPGTPVGAPDPQPLLLSGTHAALTGARAKPQEEGAGRRWAAARGRAESRGLPASGPAPRPASGADPEVGSGLLWGPQNSAGQLTHGSRRAGGLRSSVFGEAFTFRGTTSCCF